MGGSGCLFSVQKTQAGQLCTWVHVHGYMYRQTCTSRHVPLSTRGMAWHVVGTGLLVMAGHPYLLVTISTVIVSKVWSWDMT